MPKAVCYIRNEPHYRSEAFVSGLKSAGYTVSNNSQVGPGDVVVTWNRYGTYEEIADRAERAGATVLVAENGYFGKDANGLQRYAISIHGHNGSGTWHPGGPERWAALGATPKPWREAGDHILVCGQRGIGSRTMASPHEWHARAAKRLAAHTKRKIVIRKHPGSKPDPNAPTLESQLVNCWAVVVWSSASGIKALMSGIPVFYDAPHYICAGAASRDFSLIESPPMPDRLPALERMAWAQWSVDEIAAGLPFRHLLVRP